MQPLDRRAERVAVLVVVALEPARADAKDEPAVADVVDGAGHVGEQLRVAVRVARDQRAQLGVAGVGGQRGQQRVGLEVGRVGVAVERVEVVPDPDRVDPEVVGGLGRGSEVGDRGGLGVELHSDLGGGVRHGAAGYGPKWAMMRA